MNETIRTEIENKKEYIKQQIIDELECEIEYEKGCGMIVCYTPAETFAVMMLQEEMGIEIDMNASEMSSKWIGYLWIYRV